jgi:hypothetical protein
LPATLAAQKARQNALSQQAKTNQPIEQLIQQGTQGVGGSWWKTLLGLAPLALMIPGVGGALGGLLGLGGGTAAGTGAVAGRGIPV